ncbi:MAG TPA: D-alanyl-D-alanine carboxypeptidase family protein [Rhizomicrobium sp.]|nr:D-alanyl-D-alanine carboxypeptidase family protein [Rhizomicrobium sp.]
MKFTRVFAFLAGFVLLAGQAQADITTSAEHGILMDADSGQVLWAKAAFTPMPPASMSKLMTLELLFQRLKDGRVHLTDTFPVSEEAWKTGGSKMFVSNGSRVPVEDLIRGIIITSGNAACVVVAEALGGTVDGFVDMMNKRAKQLGLDQSHFVNPDGLPDPPGQAMSALDLAKLARHLINDYPQYYHYFSERSFVWNNITQQNRDMVMDKIEGGDGLKTGHTDAAGYGITTSAKQGNERLILVLNGLRYPDLDNASSARQDWIAERRRSDEAARILGLAFREFRKYDIARAGQVVATAQVWQGTRDTVPLVVGSDAAVTMQVDSHAGMKTVLHYDNPIKAPIVKGQQVGTMDITAPDFPGMTIPLYAGESVGRAGIFGRIYLGIRSMIWGH